MNASDTNLLLLYMYARVLVHLFSCMHYIKQVKELVTKKDTNLLDSFLDVSEATRRQLP